MYTPLNLRLQKKIKNNHTISVVLNEAIDSAQTGRDYYDILFSPTEGANNSYSIMSFVTRFTPEDVIIEPLSFTPNVTKLPLGFRDLYASLGLAAIEAWAKKYGRKKIYVIFDNDTILQISMDRGYLIRTARPQEAGRYKGIKSVAEH